MKSSVQTITPAVAAKLLEQRAPNRSLSRARVTALAQAMRDGEWINDGSPVRRSDQGLLLDGQHRLSAIIEADMTIELLIVEDIDLQAQLTIDTNRPRSFADYLTIKEVPAARSLAASTRFLWNYERGVFAWKGDLKKRPIATTIELWDLFSKHEQTLRDGDDWSYAVHRYVRCSRSMLGGMWLVLSDIDPGDADEFYTYMAQRFDGPQNDAVAAYARLMNNAGRPSFGGRRTQREQTALLIKAWNAYREGRSVTVLMWKGGGKNPEPFPAPR